jgi:multiple sugar transport system substrate-binding protein
MKRKMRLKGNRIVGILLSLILILAGACISGCMQTSDSPLDPDNPVSITVWHYYYGAQQDAFDALVDEFNETEGKEKGIYVQGISQGTVSNLEEAVRDSMDGKVGADDMPDIFSSYADTAYEVEQAGELANLSDYLSEEELSAYVDSYIEEGRIAEDDSLRIFPVAKSTEIMMINKTDWEKFADATGASLDDLKTLEGVVKTAQSYYEWTDAQTPDVENDGKAFYGRDSVANYFSIGMMQLGNEIFQVEKGEVTLNLDKDSLRRLWDCYYVPMVKGYFGAYGSFRSDDVKTGDLLAYTGSTVSAMYFPDKVETKNESYDIDYIVMPAPIFEGGEKYAVQQGAGMVVSKSDEQHEYASVEFLKWFTQQEENITFCGDTGYLPVLKESNSKDVFDQVIKEQNLEISNKSYDCVTQVFEEMNDTTLYTNKSFKNGSEARAVLNDNLSDKALADRKKIEKQLKKGVSLEKASADYLTDDAFEQWYQEFSKTLQEAVDK